jgi:hypothetical protein
MEWSFRDVTNDAAKDLPYATRTEDLEGSHGSQAGGASVLDAASGVGLRPNEQARFARGRAPTSPWCAVNHRCNDWASHSQNQGSSNK